MTTRRLWVCAGAAGAMSLAGLPAAAQQDWIGTAGTLFFDTASNWNPAQVPSSDVDATFGTVDVGGQEIIVGASSEANGMDFFANDWAFTGAAGGTLGSGTVTVNDAAAQTLAAGTSVLASNNLVWDSGSPAYVGTTGFGTMTFTGGSDFLMRQLFVGDGATGVGEFTATGAGTLVRASLNSNTGVFTIGRAGGMGTINILNGAQMLTSSTGANDIWVGGHSSDNDEAAPSIKSNGTLNVDGAGSFVETEDLNVGIFGGTGILNITNGGNVTLTDGGSPDAAFGTNGVNGTVGVGLGTIDGDGSLLNAREILVGNNGIGNLTISDGGEARTRIDTSAPSNITIGNAVDSFGKIAVFGTATDGTTASLLDSEDNLTVGNGGRGVLNVGLNLTDQPVGSGALQVDLSMLIAAGVGNDLENQVVIAGSETTANIGVDISVGNNGKGTLHILDGATVTVGDEIQVGLLGGSEGIVLIDGAGTTVDASFLFAGNGTGSGSTAEVTVSGGAVATFDGAAPAGANPAVAAVTLGDDDEGVGTLTITGVGSRLASTNANGQWFIGGSGNEPGGTGTANILAGAQGVAGGRTVLGWGTGSDGTLNVDGPGSVFDANGDYILVGFNGQGDAHITDGGVVNATRVFVADQGGAAGSQLEIDGVGSQLNIERRLHVGDTGRGLLNVINGGQLTVGGVVGSERFIIGDEGASDGSKLTVDGAGSRVDYTGTFDISVGNAGGSTTNRATLEVTNGGVFSAVQRNPDQTIASQARIIVGDIDGGNGHVIVNGTGSRVEASVMYVGDGTNNSTGLLDITNGGVVDLTGEFQGGSNGNGQGTINVDGPGSQLLVGTALSLGDDIPGNGTATGTMNITDGGYVSNAGQAYIGRRSGSFGTSTLDSSTTDLSVWDIGGELTIAGTETSSQTSGSGTLNANTGGVVNIASNLRVRNLGTVNLAGGTVNIGGDLILTDAGSTINFVFGKLGFTDPAGTSLGPSDLERVLAIGGGNRPTLFTNQELAIAGPATIGGPLRINGGTLSVGSLAPVSLVQVDFDAGTLNLTETALTVGSGGLFGTNLEVTSPQTLNVGLAATIDPGSALTVLGSFSSGGLTNQGDLVVVNGTVGGPVNSAAGTGVTVIGNATFTGDVSGGADFGGTGSATFAGGYSPGDSAAQVRFDGDIGFESTAKLQIEVGGTAPGTQHDQIVVAGDAQLGGHLELTLIDGFTPGSSQIFTILTSAGLTGRFDSVSSPNYPAGRAFRPIYTATSVLLVETFAADLSGDGDVDDEDLGVFFSSFTGPDLGPTVNPGADLSGDGDVDDEDLGLAFSQFTGPLSPVNIPEPGSLVMLAGLLGLAARRRR